MKRYIFLAFISSILFSCEKVITEDLNIKPNEPLLVVEGGIERNVNSPASIQKVRLTTTKDFLDDSPAPIIENAEVSISNRGQVYNLEYEGNGFYTTENIQPELGEYYTLNITWGEKTYSATDQLNEVPAIDNIYTEFEEETGITDEGYFVKIDSKDPSGISNFYFYRVYRNDTLFILPDPGNSRTIILKDDFFDGQNRTGVVPNEEVVYEIGDVAKVDQIGISKDYYDFLFELYKQTGYQGVSFTGNPPPASIRGNIISDDVEEYKALGFFRAIDITSRSVIVE